MQTTISSPIGALRLTVADDGAGGADPTRGTGLRGLTDRVATVGGTLTVADRRPTGTVLVARLPWS